MRKAAVDAAEVAKAYDQASPLWEVFNDSQIHLAYWYDERDDTPLAEAAQRITRKVVDSLGLRPGEHLLDAGCGLGAPAILVAKETGARVTGITVSNVQVTEARKRANAAGLAEQAGFEPGDFMSLTFADGSFDAVMAMESLEYAPDLGQVVRELHRVLRPGGRISVADLTTESDADIQQVEQVAMQFKINRPPKLSEWIAVLRDAGFGLDEYIQCGPRIYGMKSKYLNAINERYDELLASLGEEAVTNMERKFQRFLAPGTANIGYAIITARKSY